MVVFSRVALTEHKSSYSPKLAGAFDDSLGSADDSSQSFASIFPYGTLAPFCARSSHGSRRAAVPNVPTLSEFTMSLHGSLRGRCHSSGVFRRLIAFGSAQLHLQQ